MIGTIAAAGAEALGIARVSFVTAKVEKFGQFEPRPPGRERQSGHRLTPHRTGASCCPYPDGGHLDQGWDAGREWGCVAAACRAPSWARMSLQGELHD